MNAPSHSILPETAAETGPVTPAQLFEILSDLKISYALHRHEPIFTVAEGQHLKQAIPGIHCRNLFLRDKKEKMFLVVVAYETDIDLKKLGELLGAGGRLSFGSPERLWRVLGIKPGSVCPFCVVNDRAREVTVILDAAMMRAQTVNYHPLDNSMTIGLTPADLIKFIEHCGHAPRIVDLAPAAPDQKEEG